MTTDRLARWRASAPAGEIQREVLSLFHPAFSQTWHFRNHKADFRANVRGSTVDTLFHPFKAKLPKKDTSGRQDLQLDIFNTGPDFVAELQAAAAQPTVQIEAEYNVYFEAETDSEQTILLALSNVGITPKACTAVARWADPLNRKFPSLRYRTDTFVGLSR